MKKLGRRCLAAIAIVLWSGSGSFANAQKPIRIGASASRTGTYAALGQNQLRGYELCVKDTNEKRGVLGRKLELVVEDDRSQPASAVRIYERLIIQEKVDLVLGPYGSPMTAPVSEVAKKHKMPMVAPTLGTTSVVKDGLGYIFQVYSHAEVYLEGFVELVARHGLKTIALIAEGSLFPQAALKGASELARKKGLQVVFTEVYGRVSTDFSAILTRVRATSLDALGAATFFEDAVAITRQLKQLKLNPKMYGATVGVGQPEFYRQLGGVAEFVYEPRSGSPSS